MPTFWLTEVQKFGVAFCLGGAFCLMMGIIFFFDRAFLAMGNILFLIGIAAIIGMQRTMLLFLRRDKIKGTVAFFTGVSLIFLRWAMIGMVIESYGLLILFGQFLTVIAGYANAVPFVGPPIARLLNKAGGQSSGTELPV